MKEEGVLYYAPPKLLNQNGDQFMIINNIFRDLSLIACFTAIITVSPALSQTIVGPIQITNTTTTNIAISGKRFNLSQIRDGISSDMPPFNGFAGKRNSIGKILLNFNGHYDLTAFYLWNDINVRAEGVATYNLRFYRSNGFANVLIATKMNNVANFGQISAQVLTFPMINDVSSVELQITSLQNQKNTAARAVEIREVAFDGVWFCGGNPSTC
jgi:hypothetical protein